MKLFKPSTPRHRIEKTESEASITINSRRNLGSILFFALYNFMWIYLASGLSIIWWGMFLATTGILDPEYKGAPVFILVFCALSISLFLLLFFGVLGIYRFLWEIAGKELIEINRERTIIIRQLFGWKKIREFSNKRMSGLTTRNTKQNPFQSLLQILFRKLYRFAFELKYDGKTHRFGYLVKEHEAKEIISALQTFISQA